MISQKQMNEWVPKAVEHFQSVMSPINCPYPQYKIVTDRTADSIRTSLLEQTGSQAVICSGTAAMETLHGPQGDAIIIYQKRFNGQLFRGGGEDMFRHFYWHELGHFYSLNKADPSLLRFADQKPHPDEYEALLGYAFWTEFIAEVIACKVEPDPCKWPLSAAIEDSGASSGMGSGHLAKASGRDGRRVCTTEWW